MAENRRKLTNLVLDSKALIRLSVPFLILMVTGLASIFFMVSQLSSEIDQVQALTNDSQLLVALNEIVLRSTYTGVLGLAGVGLLSLLLWILYSHRIFGPKIPIRRHIEALCVGDYKSRIHLRKRDEFKDVADDLNRLAEILGKSAK